VIFRTRFAFLSIVLAFASTSLNAQQLLNPYKGLWHYQNGNQDFQVVLWQEGEYMFGHFKMVEVNEFGEQTNLIYTSKKTYIYGRQFPFTIFGGISEFGLTGLVSDNTIPNFNRDFKDGWITIKIVPACNDCGTQATWLVTPRSDFTDGEPPMNIPLDIVLTKISNTVPHNF
jgi:hypothetical protein